MTDDAATVVRFVGLVFLLSLPFWAIGASAGQPILPGLPISALMVAAPAIAALGLTALREGVGALRGFAGRVFDARRTSLLMILTALAIMPVSTLAVWLWMAGDGATLPPANLSPTKIGVLFLMFWIAGAAEELGWSGYLANPAQRLWGFLGAAVAIGSIWALWHVVPLLQAGRGWLWIAWWSLATVAARAVALAMFRWSNDSVFAVSTLHAAQNTAWQCFPIEGSHFDPSYAAPVFAVPAALCATAVLAKRQRQ